MHTLAVIAWAIRQVKHCRHHSESLAGSVHAGRASSSILKAGQLRANGYLALSSVDARSEHTTLALG